MSKPLSPEELRLKWIGDRFAFVGYVNRKDISSAFGVSDAQATRDLGKFIMENPGDVDYDSHHRRYRSARRRDQSISEEVWKEFGYPLTLAKPIDFDLLAEEIGEGE